MKNKFKSMTSGELDLIPKDILINMGKEHMEKIQREKRLEAHLGVFDEKIGDVYG